MCLLKILFIYLFLDIDKFTGRGNIQFHLARTLSLVFIHSLVIQRYAIYLFLCFLLSIIYQYLVFFMVTIRKIFLNDYKKKYRKENTLRINGKYFLNIKHDAKKMLYKLICCKYCENMVYFSI